MAEDRECTIANQVNDENVVFHGKKLYIHEMLMLNDKSQIKLFNDRTIEVGDTRVTMCDSMYSNKKLLYHGAPIANIEGIIKENFIQKPGMHGHIGQGWYFSDMLAQTIYYCLKDRYTGDETDFVVLVCEVDLGRCRDMRRSAPPAVPKTPQCDSHSTEYYQDGKHGREYCLFDSDQILPICRLHLKAFDTS